MPSNRTPIRLPSIVAPRAWRSNHRAGARDAVESPVAHDAVHIPKASHPRHHNRLRWTARHACGDAQRGGIATPRSIGMSVRTKPPFRADHVGSFLRPAALLEARERKRKGEISRRATARSGRRGDSRYRPLSGRPRASKASPTANSGEPISTSIFWSSSPASRPRAASRCSFHSAAGNVDFAPPVMHVTAPVRHVKPIQVDDFKFLRSVTKRTPKVTIPSPTMLHFRGGREAISREAYPDLEQFFADVAAAYRAEIHALAEAGCTLPAARRHQPRLSLRRQDARRRDGSAATIPTSCRAATRA